MNNENVNEKQLENVAGGNNHDTEKEARSGEALYKEGDIVEVYRDGLHVRTRRCRIDIVGGRDGRFIYYVIELPDETYGYWKTADDIQGKVD